MCWPWDTFNWNPGLFFLQRTQLAKPLASVLFKVSSDARPAGQVGLEPAPSRLISSLSPQRPAFSPPPFFLSFFPLYRVFTWKIMSGSSKSLSLFLSELLVSTDVHACCRANDTRPKHANRRHWQKYLRDFRVRLAASSLFPIGKSSHVLPLRFSRAPYATHRFYGCISYDPYDNFSNLCTSNVSACIAG